MLASQVIGGTLTYRKLDYWTRLGYVQSEIPDPGSGGIRNYTEKEAQIAYMIDLLTEAGISLRTAAWAARSIAERPCSGTALLELAPGVALSLAPSARPAVPRSASEGLPRPDVPPARTEIPESEKERP